MDPAPERIEVDSNPGYVFIDAIGADTFTLRSSAFKYRWENGRRYHGEHVDSYWGPNDEQQQEAEDISLGSDSYIISPTIPQRVLDIGCGTGAWAIDFADENPSAEVIGIDISPIQPSLVPPNCRFEVDDINKPWTFPSDYFDFIHVRNMLGTVRDWMEFHKTALMHIAPGGWIEQVEISAITRSDDGTIPSGSALERWSGVWSDVSEKLGITFHTAEISFEAIQAAGFTNIHQRIVKIPFGTWPKDRKLKAWGELYQYFLLQGIEGFALRSLIDWSYDEAQIFLAEIRKELRDPSIHGYSELRIVFGQKPLK
ncbi:hypothetical protein SAPIO_CDS0313 [Scedosporium apiospermum]|uniref:Methyltransferase domain-containing protein n=1 Tax=Pseudallescheria apiosperma TaxID=563466 RepID=A0A084GGR4_PSEDA|nr:uncharacterized protein SAPIO_CDS0313 [Scedosporium apiospermum]KEZ46526.1 hypothetical protein SAPIO_CDS0313 [Scedosporium apiospermum]